MNKMLSPFAKTMPSNYTIVGGTTDNPEAALAGGSLTKEAWAKAERQANPDYDWAGYQYCVKNSLFDHPRLAHREAEQAMIMHWNDILTELDRKPEVREEHDE